MIRCIKRKRVRSYNNVRTPASAVLKLLKSMFTVRDSASSGRKSWGWWDVRATWLVGDGSVLAVCLSISRHGRLLYVVSKQCSLSKTEARIDTEIAGNAQLQHAGRLFVHDYILKNNEVVVYTAHSVIVCQPQYLLWLAIALFSLLWALSIKKSSFLAAPNRPFLVDHT